MNAREFSVFFWLSRVNVEGTRPIYRGEFVRKLVKSISKLASGEPQFVRERESRMNVLSVEICSLLIPPGVLIIG